MSIRSPDVNRLPVSQYKMSLVYHTRQGIFLMCHPSLAQEEDYRECYSFLLVSHGARVNN